MNKEQNLNIAENQQLNIAGVMRRLSDFKFRFWNEKRKKMSGVWTYKGAPFLGKGYVMEWVGMNDIENTMVFEGDIFKNVDTGEYCVVRKYKGKFITDYGSTKHFEKWNHRRFDVGHTIGNLHLICGNIFQNANLVSDLTFVDDAD